MFVLEIIFIIAMMLFLFGITIFVHEFGHFIVARKCGLVVETFSIGMGPALWKKEIGGIVYKIGAFPIGGYVSLPQLDPESMDIMQGDAEGDRQTMPDISPWKKIAVSVAGPLFNVVFAVVLAWLVFLSSNQPIIEDLSAIIGTVSEDSTAYQKGIRPGDTIIAVNGTAVHTWTEFLMEGFLGESTIQLTLQSGGKTKTVEVETIDLEKTGQLIEGVNQAIPCLLGGITKGSAAEKAGLQVNDVVTEFAGTPVVDWAHFTELVQDAPDKEVGIKVRRDGQEVSSLITPIYSEKYERVMVGVGLGSFRYRPMEQIKTDSTMIFRTLKGLVTPKESGKVAKSLQGPIGIFKILWDALSMGIIPAIAFIRFININLAVLNLLPIPILDGGHICFSLWEGITRRKVHKSVISISGTFFAILLIAAMIFLSWRDAGGQRLIKKLFPKEAPATEVAEPQMDEPQNPE